MDTLVFIALWALGMAAARDLFAGSQVAAEAFGQEVVDHYVNYADVEIAAFDAAVTDWEIARYWSAS